MRVPLDECVPRGLKRDLPGHDVVTVAEAGWAGTKNGELLGLAARDFDVFLTVDRRLTHQQDVRGFDIAVITLVARSNRRDDLRPLMSRVAAHLDSIRSGDVIRVAREEI
jgi:hypothetical protein